MLSGREGDREDLILRNLGRRLIRIDGYRMRDVIACHVFGTINLAETAVIISSLSKKLVLLIIRVLSEDTDSVISGPAQEKILIGKDSSSFFGGLLERCVIDHILLFRSLEILLLGGTSGKKYDCQAVCKKTSHICFVLFTNQYPDRHHRQ